jgi:membrane fusion protein (multidrug efflux system)
MGEYFVFVAVDTIMARSDSAQKKETDTAQRRATLHAFQRKVQVGQVLGSNQVVKSGLHNGERIVVDGVQAIHDGSPINASTETKSVAKKGQSALE